MVILGIETSCDETAAAVLEVGRGRVVVRSHVIASQALTHARYGGVVPEVAAREHVLAIIPTIDAALKAARLKPAKLDRLAVTSGPGLLTALLVGVETAKALALGWNKPLVSVNHIEGHIASSFLPLNGKKSKLPDIKFPALALIVSGGHTELILVKKMGSYKLIGATRDDAAGEAFDKVATLLGLAYPGGTSISRAAKNGNRNAYAFPRPMLNSKDFDFSFSGLKTAVLYQMKGRRPAKRDVPHLAASFEQAVVDVLVSKTLRAARELKVKSVLLGGGVAANTLLRTTLEKELRHVSGVRYYQPNLAFATDNAAMIAMAAVFHKNANVPATVVADSRWELV
jgi:N6-L-threonylcarbamoyladenine synthase